MADDQGSVPAVPQSVIEVTAFMPDARRDPHPKLQALRENCPVMRDEMAKTWFLTRYADIRETVNDRNFVRHPLNSEEGSISRQLVEDEENPRRTSILFLDEPDHSRVRPPLAKAFYARINKMKAEIEAIVDETIEAAPASGVFDLMAEIAVPIPVTVIARILGVDEHRLTEFRQWSEDVILSLNPVRTPEETQRMMAGGEALDAYFSELMERRRVHPADDLITDMVQLQASGDAPLTDDEIRINLQALLVGGNLTTTDLIGNGVWLFLTHPDQLTALKSDPALAAQAVEEVLRYEAPVSATSRIVEKDREVAGCPMKEHQVVFCSLASANRDAATFEAPETFDITQKRASHVAFGGGPHICIGAPLARMEARRVYQKLFARYPDMTLPEQDLAWRALPFFRGLERLDVKV
ncbi:MAG: cytochrome P450 [Hyphomonas sp.]